LPIILSKNVDMPKIPKEFVENSPIIQVLQETINEFNCEEKSIIYLYCFISLSVNEIATLSELSTSYVVSTLVLYSEKLAFKLDVFKKAVPYDDIDLVPIQELFELDTCIVS